MGVDLADFRVLERLGEGAAGTVFLATPRNPLPYARPGDPLAIKQYKPELLKRSGQVKRMKQEFLVGSDLSHKNVVRMFDSNLVGSNPFLVMEYVDGVALSTWIPMFHQVPGTVVLKIFRELVDGVASLHEAGVLHRDLKPANVMMTSSLAPRIMDLGVVRVNSQELRSRFENEDESSSSVQFLGTIRNAAPEALRGEDYDEAADLYSLGTILYALLHGYEVFADEAHWVNLVHLVEEAQPEIDEGLCGRDQVCQALGELVPQLLAKDPADRLGDVHAVMRLLQPVEEIASRPGPIQPLHGYVATALTGLDDDAGEAMAFLSATVADVAKGYGIYVYQPRRFTDPLLHVDVDPILVYLTDRRRVSDTDILFLVLNKPSFGVGQEIEIAASYGRPVILLSRDGTTISRMVTGSFSNILDQIVYSSPDDLERKLRKSLQAHIASVREAAATSRQQSGLELGSRVAQLRESMGYRDAAELAATCSLPARAIQALEQGAFENIGLQMLARVCRALEISIPDLLRQGRNRSSRTNGMVGTNASLRSLETYARKTNLVAADYFQLRDDYRHELAARGNPYELSEADWAARRTALDQRHLCDADQVDAQGELFGG